MNRPAKRPAPRSVRRLLAGAAVLVAGIVALSIAGRSPAVQGQTPADPQAQIEQGFEPERVEGQPMTGLGGEMSRDHRVGRSGSQPRRDERRRRRDESVEHYDLMVCRGAQRKPAQECELESPERCQAQTFRGKPLCGCQSAIESQSGVSNALVRRFETKATGQKKFR